MSESPQLHTILCEEVFDENSVPSEEEVIDYASKIGIDPKSEPHLLPIAVNGLMHPLPSEWKPCFRSDIQKWYYFNTETKESQWEHPLDDFYRQVVKRGRSEGYSSAGDDDSKTTAKEDLKSFEEASDILSSKSVDIKPDALEDKREFAVMTERGPLLKGSQPLLLRRKQLQSGQDPLHVPKLINSTFRQSLPQGDVPQRSGYGDLPPPVPALRRSQTSDVITPHPPPIKGILRESSFSGSMSSSAKASSVRFTPSQGDATAQSEGEDEKKRSVRFADFERQSLDIRFQLSDSDETYSDVNDDDSTSSSPIGEKAIKEIEVKTKPKILSPLRNTTNPGTDFPKTRKFTVTPVKETAFGFPVSDLKGLFRRDSVGPLDSDSDLSLGGVKEGDSPSTGVGKETELEYLAHKLSHPEPPLEHSPPSEEGNQRPMEVSPPGDTPMDDGIQGLLKRVPALTDLHSLEVIGDGPVRTVNSGTDLTEFNSALSVLPSSSEDKLGEVQKEKLISLQKKLNEELESQVEELKALQRASIAQLKESLMNSEESEKNKLREEFEANIKNLKDLLQAEYLEKEKELRESHRSQLDSISSELQKGREEEMGSIRSEYSDIIKKWKAEQEQALTEEKILLDNESFENIQKIKTELKNRVDDLMAQSEARIREITTTNERKISDLIMKFEESVKEIHLKHQNEIKELEESHRLRMEVVRREKESELLRTEGEWEDRLAATSLSQRAHLDSVEREYEGRLARLRADWEKEEADLRRRRTPLDQFPPLPVDYEKMRCEKRLLEDKYRSLKEKYVQLKKDVKLAVEKKLQARTRRKRGEDLEKDEVAAERPKNLNRDLQPSSLTTPKITVGEVSPRDVTDPSSDDQYTFSFSHPEKHVSSRKVRSQRRDRTPISRAEETQSPIEEISGDIYLRHPLSSLGLSRSAEVDFYRQRVLAEGERATRESSDGPRRDPRDVLDNNNSLGLHQQERDLNDLEVSLHRTRALFGEKMIRLRLLGQTLSRLADDTASPPSNSGGEIMSPSNVLQNLDNINAEIREIWNQLNKNQAGLVSGAGQVEVSLKTEDKCGNSSVAKNPGHHHRPSKRSEIEARLQGLRDWLQKPPPPDWAQLTL